MLSQARRDEISTRYASLAEDTCCLSCGAALSYADPLPGEVCVDLGSGRGQDVLRMADAVGAGGHGYGVDVSAGMLTKARRTAQKLGIGNATFVQSELEAIALPDAMADLVLSNCTINHAADKAAVWAEVFRILKPGGRFVVSDIYSVEEVPARFRSDPAAVAECWAGAVVRQEYLATLEDTGFEAIRILEESTPYDKGAVQVASFTVAGRRPGGSCCCGA